MKIIGIIIAIIAIAGFITTCLLETSDNEGSFYSFMSFICGIACAIAVFMTLTEPKPNAMDVYEGKTTLEYTIVNGEVKDSVVVWKFKED